MNTKILEMPDEATLKRYWGSAEAYLEEQRRTATYNLEAYQVSSGMDTSNQSLLSKVASKTANQSRKANLHLPFSFRHA